MIEAMARNRNGNGGATLPQGRCGDYGKANSSQGDVLLDCWIWGVRVSSVVPPHSSPKAGTRINGRGLTDRLSVDIDLRLEQTAVDSGHGMSQHMISSKLHKCHRLHGMSVP